MEGRGGGGGGGGGGGVVMQKFDPELLTISHSGWTPLVMI